MLWGLVLSTPTPILLTEGRASSRLPFQARDLERRYGLMSSLAGAFRASGLIVRMCVAYTNIQQQLRNRGLLTTTSGDLLSPLGEWDLGRSG